MWKKMKYVLYCIKRFKSTVQVQKKAKALCDVALFHPIILFSILTVLSYFKGFKFTSKWLSKETLQNFLTKFCINKNRKIFLKISGNKQMPSVTLH